MLMGVSADGKIEIRRETEVERYVREQGQVAVKQLSAEELHQWYFKKKDHFDILPIATT